ncbi:MAG: response regulator transcription factor [Chloroflexi bacterium]|nr:response regulator transcription factor [Chloroflexota bacterium]
MGSHVLVVDDDEKITSFLRRALAYEGYQVQVARSGTGALSSALESPPDVVVLDVMMPGLDGLEVCRRLRAGGDVPVLMLTARDGVSDRVQGLDVGADDYLTKPFALEELLARLRALLRRRESSAPVILRFADLSLDLGSRAATRNSRLIDLTTKQFELLALFMRHPRRVLTRQSIMEQVWGYDFDGESNVIEVYVGHLRQKLEAGGESRLIHTVRHAGYVLRE